MHLFTPLRTLSPARLSLCSTVEPGDQSMSVQTKKCYLPLFIGFLQEWLSFVAIIKFSPSAMRGKVALECPAFFCLSCLQPCLFTASVSVQLVKKHSSNSSLMNDVNLSHGVPTEIAFVRIWADWVVPQKFHWVLMLHYNINQKGTARKTFQDVEIFLQLA